MRAICSLSLAVLTAMLALTDGEAQEAPRTWVYEATSSWDPGTKLVEDPNALDGKALECPATTNVYTRWWTFFPGYITDHVPGEYQVTFRVKVADNTGTDPLFSLVFGVRIEHVRGRDFTTPGMYQEFSYAYTIPTRRTMEYCIRRLAGPTVWIDRVTVVQKRAYTDTEQLEFAKFERPDDPRLIPHPGINVWFVKGLYYRHYRLHTALEQMGALLSDAHVIRAVHGSTLAGIPLEGKPPEKAAPVNPEDKDDTIEPLPASPYDTVMRRDLIVLCDVDAECLTVQQRALIHDFVKAGGGLLVIGGPFAFGRGAMERSELLEALLPVTTSGAYDLQPLAKPAPLQPAKGRIPKDGLAWGQRPTVMWMHQAQAKQGATVELIAGGQPALVTWEYGKGRVAALTATVLGEPPLGSTAFWEWSDWPRLMTNLTQWLSSGKTNDIEPIR